MVFRPDLSTADNIHIVKQIYERVTNMILLSAVFL
jgi:hypothetical protein